jgi:hypothetical protein
MSPFLTRIPFNKGLGSRISVSSSASPPIPATLVYDLDAANFSGFPHPGGSLLTGLNQAVRLNTFPHSAFTYGTGDFTVEWWSNQYQTNGAQGIWRNSTNDTLNAIGYWTITQAGGRLSVSLGNGTTTDVIQSNNVITVNTWNHFAFVRNGNVFKLYVNGVAQTSTLTSSISLPAQVGIMQIGNAGGNFYGRVTNFRIVKGTAVYTSNFTPSTRPLKAIPGTSLLLLVWGNTPLLDSGPYTHTVTNSGSAYDAMTPFSTVNDATGTYPITVNNAGSVDWSNAGEGSWIKTSNVGTDWIKGGPDYTTGQSYTVFMAYKLSTTSSGRLLNTNSEVVKDWYMGSLNGNPSAFSPNFAVNQPVSGADTIWHLDWATWDNSTSTGKLYTSTNTAPTDAAFTATDANGGGFNQFRIFNRNGALDTQTGNIAFVKVYNGVLTLAEIQALHAQYVSRFYNVVTTGLQVNLTSAPTTGSTWTDTSGNGRNATLAGTPSYISASGGGIKLNNVNSVGTDYISVPYNIESATVTVEIVASFNPTSFWGTIWGNDSYTAGRGYLAYMTSSTGITYGRPNSVAIETIAASNDIRHWTFVINNTSASLYLNGSQVGTTDTIGTQTLFVNSEFYFGARHVNNGVGPADRMNNSNSDNYPVFYQMRIYSRALSVAEITQNYTAVRGTYGI